MTIKSLEPQDWINQLCRGEEAAYRYFFEEYYQVLGVFAMKYVRKKEIAEDIINDVVLELYSRKLHFKNVIALKSFLYLSIKNRCLNYLRHDEAKERYLQSTGPEREQTFFLDNIIEEEIYYLLQKAVNELAEPVKEIYKLSLEGKTNEEIAAQLNLTIDSVKAYKKRGKAILREKLKGLVFFLSIYI